ncbi:nuclear factor of activated T-cells, cytoplasmic 1-like [Neopelma chrysocephalum]|uniref:nuclear factor of activated T-cells, cytoplasmic 1-like n=1 Tax=Neopelma chrysocephalum TaxID=114329 RepID=UPI000FCD114C|nr:nuclear factor of activated T-cells, cytoplasmic 1-like [Neopelma chrysocephalum]
MNCYGERYKALYLPGPGYGTESIQQCPTRADGCGGTCHPLSIIKGPVPRWQSCPQPLTYVCPQPAVSQPSLLQCQPYVQKCLLLYPEPCETTRLLPSIRLGSGQSCQPCETFPRPEKRRVAKSLPPCAPPCPEPGKLRFPPCGIRSSASCRVGGRSPRLAKSSSRWFGPDLRPPGLAGLGYSLPLGGVTECPPQPCVTHCCPQEYAGGFPQHKCTKGYPTQECVPPSSAEQRLAKGPPETREHKCPPGKGLKECPAQKPAAKISLPQEGVKGKGSSTQHLSKSRCLYPRAPHRPGHHHHHPAGAKRSSHPKKSRCASKWIW